MKRRELLDKLSASAEERVLLGRLWDALERCRSRNVPEESGFLSPHEQALAGQLMQALGVQEGWALWGGYQGAQRRQMHFSRTGPRSRRPELSGRCGAGFTRRTTLPTGTFWAASWDWV